MPIESGLVTSDIVGQTYPGIPDFKQIATEEWISRSIRKGETVLMKKPGQHLIAEEDLFSVKGKDEWRDALCHSSSKQQPGY